MTMRITNNMMVSNFLTNMQTNLRKMDKYTSQLSSNRKIVALSDDPVGVYSALTARQRLTRYEQYQSQLVTARNWSEQVDTSLQEVSGRIAYMKEQLIYATDSWTKTPQDRAHIGSLVAELKNSVMDALNTVVGDQYIFAGFNTVNQPFTLDTDGKTVLYNGIDLSQYGKGGTTTTADGQEIPLDDAIAAEQNQYFAIDVGYDLEMEISINGVDVAGVGDDNMFKIFNDIIALMDEEPDVNEEGVIINEEETINRLSGMIDFLDKAHENIATQIVRAGGMTSQIDILEDRYSQDVINYNNIRSKIEDIDSAETIMDWKMAEAVYKQSLATGARVIQPTLMDFLN